MCSDIITKSTFPSRMFLAANYRDPIFPKQTKKSIDDIPVDIIAGMAARLYMLLNLAWDYVETIQQVAKLMRLDSAKKVSRRINELHQRYDQRRSYSLTDKEVLLERKIALLFETFCSPHLTKLHYSLTNEIKRAWPEIGADDVYLAEAVETAATILDAVIMFGKECDSYISSQGVTGHSVITGEILELYRMLPQFMPRNIKIEGSARKLTAKILFNEIKQLELIDNDGKTL